MIERKTKNLGGQGREGGGRERQYRKNKVQKSSRKRRKKIREGKKERNDSYCYTMVSHAVMWTVMATDQIFFLP